MSTLIHCALAALALAELAAFLRWSGWLGGHHDYE